jgi:hypothetical protein
VEAFSTRLRDEIDLDTLAAELLAVVDQTTQPTQAYMWLRPHEARPPEGERSRARDGTSVLVHTPRRIKDGGRREVGDE